MNSSDKRKGKRKAYREGVAARKKMLEWYGPNKQFTEREISIINPYAFVSLNDRFSSKVHLPKRKPRVWDFSLEWQRGWKAGV